MLLDSNVIICSAKREYAELRRFMAENAYSVSAISIIEVLGYLGTLGTSVGFKASASLIPWNRRSWASQKSS